LERLEQISSEVTEEEAKERAKEAAEKARTLERQELDQIGVGRLRSIMEQLFGMIRGVPRVKVKVEGLEGNQTYSAGLKRGRLSVGVAEFRKLSPYEFFEVWDVICGSRIHVSYSTQSGGHNSRGASLWYTDLGEGSGRYRWYEVAYFRTKDIDYVPPTPEALPPGQNAAYAVGGKLGWKLANQPSPIETAEQIERFCQRWLMLFAQACDQESLSQFAEKDLGISLA
jgi:hypothetical protein